MRLILPPTGSCPSGSLHISLPYSNVHFSISSQAARMLKGSFCKHLQSNLLIILFKLSKAYFWPTKFILPVAHVTTLLSNIPTKAVLLPPSAFPSVCYPLVSHTLAANSFKSRVSHLPAHPVFMQNPTYEVPTPFDQSH